jgi:hypothetical protein
LPSAETSITRSRCQSSSWAPSSTSTARSGAALSLDRAASVRQDALRGTDADAGGAGADDPGAEQGLQNVDDDLRTPAKGLAIVPPEQAGSSRPSAGPIYSGTPGGIAAVSSMKHISFCVPQPGRMGSVSALVSYSHVTRKRVLPSKGMGAA